MIAPPYWNPYQGLFRKRGNIPTYLAKWSRLLLISLVFLVVAFGALGVLPDAQKVHDSNMAQTWIILGAMCSIP